MTGRTTLGAINGNFQIRPSHHRSLSLSVRTSEDEEMLELIPVNTDHELQCGNRLEIKILPKSGNPKGPAELTITAHNVDAKTYETAVARMDYKVVVVPVHRLEIVADKTSLKAEDAPVMFGVGAYDAAGNELDTLDGVQLSWFIGRC